MAASLPKVRAKRAEQARNARPYGVTAMPLHAAMASGWQLFGGTTPLRAQRVLKGKGLIRKKGKTAGVPLLVRSAAAQAAPPARDARALLSPCRANTQEWRAEVVAPYEKSTAA